MCGDPYETFQQFEEAYDEVAKLIAGPFANIEALRKDFENLLKDSRKPEGDWLAVQAIEEGLFSPPADFHYACGGVLSG